MSTSPVAVPESQPETGPLGRMTGVIVSPTRTFAEIARRPTWVVPFLTLCVLSIIVSGLLAQKTDWRSFFERQMSKNARLDQMPQDRKDQMLENQVKYAPQVALAFGTIFTALFVLLMTLVYWGAFNLFNGAALTFKTAFGIVSHAFVPLIVSSLLAIIILLIKPRGDVDPEHFLASILGPFCPRTRQSGLQRWASPWSCSGSGRWRWRRSVFLLRTQRKLNRWARSLRYSACGPFGFWGKWRGQCFSSGCC